MEIVKGTFYKIIFVSCISEILTFFRPTFLFKGLSTLLSRPVLCFQVFKLLSSVRLQCSERPAGARAGLCNVFKHLGGSTLGLCSASACCICVGLFASVIGCVDFCAFVAACCILVD